MYFFGVQFLATAILIFFFKPEQTKKELTVVEGHVHVENKTSLRQSYMIIWRLLKLKPMQEISIFLITSRVKILTPINLTQMIQINF
jgi:hypothetical protein